MKVRHGKVVDGKVVLEGDALPDGAHVVVVAAGGDDTEEVFDLTPEEKAELLQRIREAREGPWIDAWDLLRDLGYKT